MATNGEVDLATLGSRPVIFLGVVVWHPDDTTSTDPRKRVGGSTMRNRNMAKQRILVCPICGETQHETSTCCKCDTSLDAEGLLLAEGSIGPWWIRDADRPFCPGMTYDHIADLASKGVIERHTLLRGPTTRQLWTVARHVAGISHLLGRCHRCDAHVDASARSCADCNAPFLVYRERNNLGLDRSEPSRGEVDGLSSFLADSSIVLRAVPEESMSSDSTILMHAISDFKPIKEKLQERPPQKEDRIGSPQFRSVQRRLEQSRRINRILAVALVITVILMVAGVTLWFNRE